MNGSFAIAADDRLNELPPIDVAPESETTLLSVTGQVMVREFRVVGGSAVTPEDLAHVLSDFSARELTMEELIRARDAVTELYRSRGFISSRALLPDQRVTDGVVELQLVESQLGVVEIEGARHFSKRYLARRITEGMQTVNIDQLRRRLEVLQQERGIRRIDARLEPGDELGQDRLRVTIEEESPWLLGIDAANDAPSSLGAQRAGLTLGHANLTGWGDSLLVSFSQVRGLGDIDVSYEAPITADDARIQLRFRTVRSEVVEGPFDGLDVRNARKSWRVQLTQPILRDRDTQWLIGLAGEHSRSELEVLGEPFSFRADADDDGETRVTAIRGFLETRLRSETRVFAARAQLSVGIDALDATRYRSSLRGSKVADGRFTSWLLQAQWGARLSGGALDGAQWLISGAAQLTPDSLLDAERFSVGGAGTVRGYHPNELVRDNGMLASVELRVPIFRDGLGRPVLQLAPFFDFGRAWNRDDDNSVRSIASVGLGVRWQPNERTAVNVYWGHRLRRVEDQGEDDLQDAGLHVEVSLASF